MTKQLVRNQDLASDVYRRNQIVNGSMSIAQRGNGPFTVSNAYTADRWQIVLNGSSTISVIPTTGGAGPGGSVVPCLGNGGSGFVYSAGDGYIGQTIKFSADGNMGLLRGRTVSLSARVYANTAGVVQLRFSSDGTGALNIGSAYHPGNSTWQTLTVTAAVPSDATYLSVWLYFSGASCPSWGFANAMLIHGSVAADFVPMPQAEELARSLRYYEAIGFNAGALSIRQSPNAVTSVGQTVSFYPKTILPTITKVGTWGVTNCAQPQVSNGHQSSVEIFAANTAAGPMNFIANSVSVGLTMEANP